MKLSGYLLLVIAGVTAFVNSGDSIPALISVTIAFIGGTLLGAGTAIDVIYKQFEEEVE